MISKVFKYFSEKAGHEPFIIEHRCPGMDGRHHEIGRNNLRMQKLGGTGVAIK